MRRAAALATVLLGMLAVHPALARSTRVAQIPNGAVAGCSTCHVEADYSMRNAFGQDVESTLEGTPLESADVAWMSVCSLDSDNDGESNGAELGDPCCMWTDAQAPLDTASLPGDANSVSGNRCDNDTPVDGAEAEQLPVESPPLALLRLLLLQQHLYQRQLFDHTGFRKTDKIGIEF